MTDNNKRLYLGVDGGASKIAAVVVDDQGKVVAEQTLPEGANYQSLPLADVVENLEEAVRLVVQELKAKPVIFDYGVFGLAGCNFEADRKVLTEALQKSSLNTMLGRGFEVVNDSEIALRAGTKDGVGVVIIAGTGSNCFGRNIEGETAKAGGLSHILSDEGSGYDIGLRGLQAVVQSLDGRDGETSLVSAILSHLKVEDLEGLYSEVYSKYTSKAQIASLAPIVIELAEKLDATAQDILNHSVNELVLMVDAVLRKLDCRDDAVPVVTVGSVLTGKNYVRRRFQTELLRVAPRARMTNLSVSSGMGAAMMAVEAGG